MKILFRLIITVLWIGIFFAFLTTTNYLRPIKQDKQVLNIFSWPEILNPEIVEKFEKETGVQVVRHYYTSNEELLIKLKATHGKGYDLIIPSDYAVIKLIDEELLQPIDHHKLNFTKYLNPKLIHQDFDPENTYSIPFIWEILGFGIDTQQYQEIPFEPTWKEIFSPSNPHTRISMINDPIEAIDITAHHLFNCQEALSLQEIALIRSKLQAQKPLVEAYAGVRGDYLLITKNASVAVIPSSYILRAATNYPHIDFVLPKDYCFISIENMCIPKESENSDLVYTFLNYLYQPEIFASETNTFQNFPATTNVQPYIDGSPILIKTLDALNSYEGTFFYTRQLLSEKESRSLWVELKSS
ncbi:MAG: extracellular solute-binding protein [Simkaniaceae bacterium]|nr:MAG: extracellular solute-binding protein [Simkaniaceae bacterium]